MYITVHIRGLVQGVGFRPFVYRIAKEEGLTGEVGNDSAGVVIRAVFPDDDTLARFLSRIRKESPPPAQIESIDVRHTSPAIYAYPPNPQNTFTISPSSPSTGGHTTRVAPDLAVCADCLADRVRQPHRAGYPFINCTRCGPRFSIMDSLPYDRERTSMKAFDMCEDCQTEYATVTDRRFHAQPIACNNCGPAYYISGEDAGAGGENVKNGGYDGLIGRVSALIAGGEVVALKGMGGYHLVCDALNETAARNLRAAKAREGKPFAVMFRDMDAVRQYAKVSPAEEAVLTSPRRPVVILDQVARLSPSVNPGMDTIGAMLPYMPVHYDIFERIPSPAIVVTSANMSGRPVAVSEEEAAGQLGQAALIVHHNRPIYNRADDSVVQVYGEQTCMLRRGRGYAPGTVAAGGDMDGVLAVGGDQANSFAIGKGGDIIQSQHIGDLTGWHTFNFFTEAIGQFSRLFNFSPRLIVCDAHPSYISSVEAGRMAASLSIPLIKVQHHHAHAAACMAEYGLFAPMVAVVMDGAGMGDDGCVWGGEFMVCDRLSYRRLAHLDYVPMPGGDRAAMEPYRMAVAMACKYGLSLPGAFIERIGAENIGRLESMLTHNLMSPLTSSAGRVFDAISSLLGLCDYSSFQGQAPLLLEQAAKGRRGHPYSWEESNGIICLKKTLMELLKDIEKGEEKGHISARFHATIAEIIVTQSAILLKSTKTTCVSLSGGCFRNKLLAMTLTEAFASQDIPLYIPSSVPVGDAGIAAGQMVVGSSRLSKS
ncbi:MAG: carbamoyltransferase HypF [Tannerellaceae bacterium]|jgi:hydrogenase maturation protein HypF|nr:carbamoyltransferase HypF [Tannerellaceae bacterium]